MRQELMAVVHGMDGQLNVFLMFRDTTFNPE